MGTIWYACSECEEHNPEGCVFLREMLRVADDGKWVCESCYNDAPAWTFTTRPAGECEPPNWQELPEVPEYVPVQSISAKISSNVKGACVPE